MQTKLIIHTDELGDTWIDRMAALGVHTLGIHPVGGQEAAEHLKHDLPVFRSPAFRALVDRAHEKGLAVEYEIHAMSYLLPRELFSDHPEYFRMDETGNRTPAFNLCVSNEAALSLVAENAVRLAEQLYGSAPRYFFWMDDLKGGGCRCPACRKLSFSDQQLTVMNAIIRALRRKDPNAQLAYLAYYDAIPLPKSVRPETGIFLEYAPFERDLKGSARAVPEAEKQNVRDLLAFFGKKDSSVLEYWYDNSYFSRHVKPPVKFSVPRETVRGDVAYYCDMGFEIVSSFACFLGDDYAALYGEPDVSAFSFR